MPRRIYIDCTETARIGALTGIQRTVRSIAGALVQDADAHAVLVRFDGFAFVPLDAESLAVATRPVSSRTRARRLAASLAAAMPDALLARGRDIVSRSHWALRRLQARARGADRLRYAPGDWLVLLDGTWTPDIRREVARAAASGARLCVVIYDLIKVRRPDLVSPGAAPIYTRWLERVLPLAHVIATISRTVADDVVEYLRESGRDGLATRVRHFPLGADFEAEGAGEVSSAVSSATDGHRDRTFLAVGSIEPRKDQATVVSAFERLWSGGVDARLVLVGRPGWGSGGLAQRLAAHGERGKRLFWFPTASDADLAHCYRNSVALVNVSLAEGYGLPLVEGMRNGLRIIASDIPAFREVAAGAALFVPVADARKLADAIASILAGPAGAAAPAPPTATWDESAHALLALLRAEDQALP